MPALVLWSCAPSFCPPCRSSLGALLANMPLFRVLRAILARFGVVVWVCLSWWFLWLVWVLCACGVRRIKDLLRICLSFSLFVPVFISLLQLFVLCPSLLWLSLLVLLHCLSFSALALCFLFPLRMYRQKERAQVFASSLVLLWDCLDVLKHYRYLLRFIVPVSIPFAYDSSNLFRSFRWVVYYLPVVVNS